MGSQRVAHNCDQHGSIIKHVVAVKMSHSDQLGEGDLVSLAPPPLCQGLASLRLLPASG